MAKIRIVVVDDHEVVRQGLRLSLDSEPDMVVVGEARTGREAQALAKAKKPDVVLLDAKLEDIPGPEVCHHILRDAGDTAILMLSSYQHDDLILSSLMAGAKGYVVKDVALEELKHMIRAVHDGNVVLDPKVTNQIISSIRSQGEESQAFARDRLTVSAIDIEIVGYIAEGLTNKEIGKRVHLSPHTVKDRVEKLFMLFDVHSRAELVAETLRRSLI